MMSWVGLNDVFSKGLGCEGAMTPRLLYVLFTDWFDHRIQRGDDGVSSELMLAYKQRLRRLVHEHGIRAIAEEMSFDAMARPVAVKALRQAGEITTPEKILDHIQQHIHGQHLPSVTEQISLELNILYRACDLGLAEQLPLTPWGDGTPEGVVKMRRRTFPPREQYWIQQLLALNRWPMLFVCGGDHRRSFRQRLVSTDLKVLVLRREESPEG